MMPISAKTHGNQGARVLEEENAEVGDFAVFALHCEPFLSSLFPCPGRSLVAAPCPWSRFPLPPCTALPALALAK